MGVHGSICYKGNVYIWMDQCLTTVWPRTCSRLQALVTSFIGLGTVAYISQSVSQLQVVVTVCGLKFTLHSINECLWINQYACLQSTPAIDFSIMIGHSPSVLKILVQNNTKWIIIRSCWHSNWILPTHIHTPMRLSLKRAIRFKYWTSVLFYYNILLYLILILSIKVVLF